MTEKRPRKLLTVIGRSVAAATALAFVSIPAIPTGPAQAADERMIEVVHGTGGLGGTLGTINASFQRVDLKVGWRDIHARDSDAVIIAVRAGSGYCVWEELFQADSIVPSNTGFHKVGDFNYGKGVQTYQPLTESYKRRNDSPLAQRSVMRIYRC